MEEDEDEQEVVCPIVDDVLELLEVVSPIVLDVVRATVEEDDSSSVTPPHTRLLGRMMPVGLL